MKRSLAAVLLVAVTLSGCASVSEGIGGGLRDQHPARDAYIKSYHDGLSPDYNRSYSFPVDAGARLVNVTISLATRSGGVVPAAQTPASVSVVLLDPVGAVLGGARLDAQQPSATLRLSPVNATGAYFVQIAGRGATLEQQGTDVSTAYTLGIEVDYA